MPRNGDRRLDPETGRPEIFYDPPGEWEVLDVATSPGDRPVDADRPDERGPDPLL
ncbi:hypothetical protein GCM10012283_06430 [Phycicoccus endophyticus]|nr:hypothetical protein GCM10012283_06430 [Phycicoccus endophyticus]